MKIALLLKYEVGSLHKTNIGGTEQIFLEDIRELEKRGHRVTAYARFLDDARHVHPVKYATFILHLVRRLRKLPHTKLSRLSYIFQDILMILAELYYTYKFVYGTKDNVHIGYSTPFLSLFTNRSVGIFQNAHHRFVAWKIFKPLYRRGIYLFCSRYLCGQYRRRYPFLTNKNSFVLHNAVNMNQFYPAAETRRSRKPIRLLFCGAWAPEKGLDVLLRALEQMHPSAFTLTITSNQYMWYSDFPSSNAQYVRLVHALLRRVSGVTLLGGIDRRALPPLYRAHDYTVVPSVWEEPFGLVALESIACGTPVIAFRSGGLPEIVSRTNSFILPKNIYALCQILRRIETGRGIPKPVHLTQKNRDMQMDVRINHLVSYVHSALQTV